MWGYRIGNFLGKRLNLDSCITIYNYLETDVFNYIITYVHLRKVYRHTKKVNCEAYKAYNKVV